MGKMNANEKGRARIFFSIIILFAYFSLNVGFTSGSVLCIHSDGRVLLKFSPCESCCSPDLSHASKSFNDNGRNAEELCAGDSCCPCVDIPISSYISQFCSRVTENTKASWVSAANISRFFSIPKAAERDFKKLLKFAYKNQISSLLKSTVLLN